MTEGKRFGLIGDPVAHSLSPVMHRAGFAALGIQAVYDLQKVPAQRADLVEAAMRGLASTGGGNVTVPHKAAAARALDEPTEVVTTLGACNCFWQTENGTLAGDNTDVFGIHQALANRLADRRPGRILILGAGGAAAAAGLAAGTLGAIEVLICNRTADRANVLTKTLKRADIPASVASSPPAGEYDVVINATSLGLQPSDPLPLNFDQVAPLLVLDLVYSRQRTAWINAADARKIDWIDGREVLLHQGAACYPLWFDRKAPMQEMRSALFGEVG